MLECSYLPVALVHAHCVSVSCSGRDVFRARVGAGSREPGNLRGGGRKMHTVSENNGRLKVG